MQQDIVPQRRRPTSDSAVPPAAVEPESVPEQQQPLAQPTSMPPKNKPSKLVIVLAVLLLLAFGATTCLFMQNSNLQARNTENQETIQSLNKAKAANQNKPELNKTNSVQQETVSGKLPNGQMLSFTQSIENATVTWAVYTYDKASGNLILAVSDDSAVHFVTGLPDDILKKVCQVDTKSEVSFNNVRAWYYSVKDNQVQKGQAGQCLDFLADPKSNTDTASQTEAKKVLDASQQNVRRFLNQVTVK